MHGQIPHHIELTERYLELLGEDYREQVYQEYIEKHTELVPREFVQNHGIHFDLVLRKLKLADNFITDFFYLSKSSGDWNAVFVEMEKPQCRYFKDKSTDFHPDFVKALHQISTWRAWLGKTENMASLISGLGPIRTPLGHNPTIPKFVLVYGRRAELESNEFRRNLVRTQQSHDIAIISFDSLAENLKSKHKLCLGVKRNLFFDILTDEIIDGKMFSWIEPESLRVSEKLQAELALGSGRNGHMHHQKSGGGDSFKEAATRIRVRRTATSPSDITA